MAKAKGKTKKTDQDKPREADLAPTPSIIPTTTAIQLVHIDLIDPNPWQPRAQISAEDVEELAANIDAIGLLQEPLLRQVEEGRYQSAFGHRRIEALRLLRARGRGSDGEYEKVPCKIDALSDQQMAYVALEENTERKSISPAETVRAWQRALEIEGVTVADLAPQVGVDRTTMIKNLLIQLGREPVPGHRVRPVMPETLARWGLRSAPAYNLLINLSYRGPPQPTEWPS